MLYPLSYGSREDGRERMLTRARQRTSNRRPRRAPAREAAGKELARPAAVL